MALKLELLITHGSSLWLGPQVLKHLLLPLSAAPHLQGKALARLHLGPGGTAGSMGLASTSRCWFSWHSWKFDRCHFASTSQLAAILMPQVAVQEWPSSGAHIPFPLPSIVLSFFVFFCFCEPEYGLASKRRRLFVLKMPSAKFRHHIPGGSRG